MSDNGFEEWWINHKVFMPLRYNEGYYLNSEAAYIAGMKAGMERSAKIAEIGIMATITDAILCGDTMDAIAAAIRAENARNSPAKA